MEDKKVLGQFAAKISKAKILFNTTKDTCDKLRRQSNKLEKEYEQMVEQRMAAQKMEASLKQSEEQTRKLFREQEHRCKAQIDKLNNIRELKKKLKRDKDIAQNDLLKNTLMLEQLVKQRESLQALAKQLSAKLQATTSEKDILQQQYDKTNHAIDVYANKIKDLKDEITTMKQVIEQNTTPLH